MRRIVRSRIAGSISLAGILCGGLAVNCSVCPDPKPTGAPHPDTPAVGTTHPVAGCPDGTRYRSYDKLQNPEACDGTDASGNPEMFPPGGELQITPPLVTKCPNENRPFPSTESFQVYWTICNVADNPPDTLLTYQLNINKVSDTGTITLDHALELTQPALDRCDCFDQAVVFNSASDPDPLKKLAPGSYRFNLTGLYANAVYTSAVVGP